MTKITHNFYKYFLMIPLKKLATKNVCLSNLLLFFWRKYPSENYYLVMVGLDADLDEALDHLKILSLIRD